MTGATTLPRGRREGATAAVGMTIFLGTLAMLFAALFFAYAVMRAQTVSWPPPGVAGLPRGALGVNTAVLIVASLALRAAAAQARRGRERAARSLVRVGLLLGAGFLAAQALVWRALVGAGDGPASSIYGSVFFAISGLHAVHVAGGLVALALVSLGLARGVAERDGGARGVDGLARGGGERARGVDGLARGGGDGGARGVDGLARGGGERARGVDGLRLRRLGLCSVYWDFVLVVWLIFYVGGCWL